MRNQLFAFLIVLIFSTSVNQAEKLKTNERRASGLMAYPRIGRSNLMAFPRIGRSDLATSNLNFNRRHDMEPEPDFQLYNSDFDSAPDKDYEDPRNPDPGFPGRSMNLKHTDKIPKEIERLIQDLSRSKDYRPWQKINEARFPYSNSLLLTRGLRNSQLNGYTPRLGRENEVDRDLCK
ncbi:PREDICTED: CAPA peptides-like [Habropoda laboriosa]|uniref:CAPA peptides-like n=1 Tax=Habropoda laboriosa TaxID=597456 RepID=UPI00083D57CA|nr:PREDICTED: CAPA peptides-like [Habropoda laboriosa]